MRKILSSVLFFIASGIYILLVFYTRALLAGFFGIGLLCITVWLGFTLNKAHILRLKENAEQIQLQKLIACVSSDFITVSSMNQEQKVQHTLRACGTCLQAQMSFLSLFHSNCRGVSHTSVWCDDGTFLKTTNSDNSLMDIDPALLNRLSTNGAIHIKDMHCMPEQIKPLLGKMDCRSFVAVPIESGGKTLGILGCKSTSFVKVWRDDQINALKTIANILCDALAKVNAEKEIYQTAYYDRLTRLPNGLLFRDRVNQAIHLAKRTEKMIGILFLGLHSFETFNDPQGHESGDELLKLLALRLSKCVRVSDTVSRFGGDEFLIMLNNISDPGDIFKIGDSIMDIFSHPFLLKGQEFYLSASAGISVYPADGAQTQVLIDHAGNAMHKAGEMGENRYVLCSPDMKEESVHTIQPAQGLYRVLQSNELVLHYQPQIPLESNRIDTGILKLENVR